MESIGRGIDYQKAERLTIANGETGAITPALLVSAGGTPAVAALITAQAAITWLATGDEPSADLGHALAAGKSIEVVGHGNVTRLIFFANGAEADVDISVGF